MSDALKELTEGGAQRVLYTALVAAIREHSSPRAAVTAALQAVECEHVELLNTPTQFASYLDAYHDMHEQLIKFLRAEFGE